MQLLVPTSLLLLPLISPVFATWAVKRAAVNDCLTEAEVPQVAPGTSAFTTAIQPYNRRVSVTPAAVAVPRTVAQVQAAVACGVSSGVKVNGKGGGHSYASHGLGGENGHLVISMQMFNTTSIDSNGIATVGSGLRLGQVATTLFQTAQRGISHGTCPTVGVGGLTLHGGYGFSSRAHGLTLDALVEAEVVLANSSVVVASETQNPDLFWALRGAGGSFGIVTKFKFQTFEAPASNVVFTYAPVNTTRESIKSLITQLQEFSIHDQPAELNVRASLEPRSSVSVTGVYHGHKSDFDALMQPLAQRLGLVLRSNQTLGWIKSLEHHAPGSLVPSRVPTDNMFAKSLMTPELSNTTISALVDYYFDVARDRTTSYVLQIDLHGGNSSAISQVPGNATSWGHRGAIFKMQFQDRSFSGGLSIIDFLDGWVAAIQNAHGEEPLGMYANYPDPTLTAEQAHTAYWLDNYERLSALKTEFDPEGVFMHPQAINSGTD